MPATYTLLQELLARKVLARGENSAVFGAVGNGDIGRAFALVRCASGGKRAVQAADHRHSQCTTRLDDNAEALPAEDQARSADCPCVEYRCSG